jgi:hypothetical protein
MVNQALAFWVSVSERQEVYWIKVTSIVSGLPQLDCLAFHFHPYRSATNLSGATKAQTSPLPAICGAKVFPVAARTVEATGQPQRIPSPAETYALNAP